MNRAVLARRAVAVAAVAAGCVVAAAPAFADAAPLHYVVDFSHTTFTPSDQAGSTVVGTGEVRDTSGAQVGTAEDACTVVTTAANGDDTVQCTVTLKLHDGELQIDTLGQTNPVAAVHQDFQGTVQGGTDAYDGAKGEVYVSTLAPAVYDTVIVLK